MQQVVMPMVRAGIYIRISRARRELLDAQRQEPPCRAFIADHGWQVVEVYTDDNRSAWKEGIRRDDFERMLADVRAGKLDAIVSWQADRLLRTVVDASAIVAIAKQHGTLVANVGGELDLSTAAGRKKFYDLAVAAEYESDLRSERLRLKHAELAADGKWEGGMRGFGYDLEPYPDLESGRVKYRLVVNQAEAQVIQQGAEAALEGRGATGIAKQWTKDGIRSTHGKVITPQKAREILVSPRIAGLRRSEGKLVTATWPAIITREQHEELVAIFGPQRRQRPGGPTSPRKRLLGGLAVCGRCGHRLTGKVSANRLRYYCDPKHGGCGGLVRAAEPLEAWVVSQLLLELPGRLVEATRRAPETWESLGRLLSARQAAEDALEGLEDFLADGLLDRSGYIRQRRRIKAKLEELEEQIAHVRAQAPRRKLRGAFLGEIEAEWEQLDLEDKRALLADHILRITVLPVGRGRQRITPDSVEIIWRQP
jgi:DNA invertase Pin-like site-specific DNA recombinase